MATSSSHSRALWLIAAFKLVKATVLFVVGLGLLRLVHKDVAEEVLRWADIFRVDPNGRYFARVLAAASTLNARRIRELSLATFFYAALFFTEGIGLSFRQTWAEYVTIISTASLMPLEIREVIRRTTFPRELTLVLNIAVVIYLIFELRSHGHRTHGRRRSRS